MTSGAPWTREPLEGGLHKFYRPDCGYDVVKVRWGWTDYDGQTFYSVEVFDHYESTADWEVRAGLPQWFQKMEPLGGCPAEVKR